MLNSKYIFPLLLLLSVFSLINCNNNPYSQGKIMYENFCVNCHMEDGSGLTGNIPPLAGADYLKTHQQELACIIRNGMNGEIMVNGTLYDTPMKGSPRLKDVEIANIINYINHEWGNDYGYIAIQEVQRQLEECGK